MTLLIVGLFLLLGGLQIAAWLLLVDLLDTDDGHPSIYAWLACIGAAAVNAVTRWRRDRPVYVRRAWLDGDRGL